MKEDFDIADKSYNKDTGELTQFLVFWSNGEPELKRASAENVLLFDPEDDLPFDNGLYQFLNGQQAIKLSEDPVVIVAPTENDYAYILRVGDNTVETTPNQADRVLEGIRQAVTDGSVEKLRSVYDTIVSEQVRRRIIAPLLKTFSAPDRIEKIDRGWLIDGFYLVDWNASVWTIDDDPDEGDYKRSGGSAKKVDRSYEFVQIRCRREMEPYDITINGAEYRLTEREMLFLMKVKFMLNRRHYHADIPFWKHVDHEADVDWQTGKPEEADDPSSGKFSL